MGSILRHNKELGEGIHTNSQNNAGQNKWEHPTGERAGKDH